MRATILLSFWSVLCSDEDVQELQDFTEDLFNEYSDDEEDDAGISSDENGTYFRLDAFMRCEGMKLIANDYLSTCFANHNVRMLSHMLKKTKEIDDR